MTENTITRTPAFARIILSAWLALMVVAAPLPLHAEQPAIAEQVSAEPFDEVWRLVRDRFYDLKLHGLDWQAAGDKYRPQYSAAKTAVERSAAINAMLSELKASHTRHYTNDDPSYYQLAEIFSYPLRSEIAKHFLSNKVIYPGIGIFTKAIEGKTFVYGVMAGLPGEKAGLLTGDEIISADGKPFAAVGSFTNKTGTPVSLEIRREANGETRRIIVVPETIEPGEAFKSSLRESARIIERDGKKIGYIRFWSYAGSRYQDVLEEELRSGKLKDADALIWDLRGGWGGARPNYLDIFVPQAITMTMTERDGSAEAVNFRWRKPVALLIDNGSRSGKEVLAHGFKELKLGPIIGERTAGAVLAATAFMLSDGSLLVLAVNDVSVNGTRLEGNGVTPTIEQPFDIRYAGGKDPQIERAMEELIKGRAGGEKSDISAP
jgi:carboxyl-terminal processing protease